MENVRVLVFLATQLFTHALVFNENATPHNTPPSIRLVTLGHSTPSIWENEPLGSFILVVLATDLDPGPQGQVWCSTESNTVQLVPLTENAFKMVLFRHVDREVQASFEVEVTCVDGGSPQLSSSKTVSVKVYDVNDNAPVFSHQVYTASVSARAPSGTLVTRVAASDLDEGLNGELMFMLRCSMTCPLRIDLYSGQVVMDHRPGEDVASPITATVVVRDRGDVILTSTATLTVVLTDDTDA